MRALLGCALHVFHAGAQRVQWISPASATIPKGFFFAVAVAHCPLASTEPVIPAFHRSTCNVVAELYTKRRKQTDNPMQRMQPHWPRGCSGVMAARVSPSSSWFPAFKCSIRLPQNGRIKASRISSVEMVGREVLLEVWRPNLQATRHIPRAFEVHDDQSVGA